jgi:hydroxymethyl cephem carbamoyltransferase
MLVLAFNPGHDGAVAAVQDRKLLFSIESEKDSDYRYERLRPMSLLIGGQHIERAPDVIAMGGWFKTISHYRPSQAPIGAGYRGSHPGTQETLNLAGKEIKFFSSSHIRSHIAMALGMGPRHDSPLHAVLVWEGEEGTFYLVNESWAIVREVPVLTLPGVRYGLLFSIADPSFPDDQTVHRRSDPGKLMALASYADATDAGKDATEIVDLLLAPDFSLVPALKSRLRESPLYNVGVDAEVTKAAAALLTKRMFDLFAQAALEHLPSGIPLYISGGCGLNCDWNRAWLDLGHFSSVFVPPCANDSGTALGTAIDAIMALTGNPYIEWSVYSGLEFESDCEPDPSAWRARDLDLGALASALADGSVVAWVQGRWEIGPRALGNRSLLAEPFQTATRDRLNAIKQREGYRPIAPCCRLEDAGKLFDADFEDPYMLYFRMVTDSRIKAVTHVDGSARVQTVTRQTNGPLHSLLSAFADRTGIGILCNTSLNFSGLGFINRMSDLVLYCDKRGIDDFVVGDRWFQRLTPGDQTAQPPPHAFSRLRG